MAGSGRNLLQALEYWGKEQPEKVLHTFLDDHGEEIEKLTYKSLMEKSGALAAHMLAPTSQKGLGLTPGERVLLVYPPSLDFMVAFYACVRARLIAVPVFPPDPRKAKKDLYLFTAIQGSSGARVALTNKTYDFAKKLGGIKSFLASSSNTGSQSWPEMTWVTSDSVVDAALASAAGATDEFMSLGFEPVDMNSPAFLQFTSGSTSDPKGVIITHSNLAHNLDLIVTGLTASDDTIVVSWLPLYHDMGLIGSYLGAMYCGGSGFYMSPLSFIRSPTLWVRMISKHRGTHMQAPNFAYGLVARKFLELRPAPVLDLSCVRHMINAAEPVRWFDIERFYAVFENSGLPRGVVYPTYGLAEHTVFVCSNGKGVLNVDKKALEVERKVVELAEGSAAAQDTTKAMSLVGCGFPGQAKGVELAIVDAAGGGGGGGGGENEDGAMASLGEDRVGEIWVRSGSRAHGYWGLHEKSIEDFGGKLAVDDQSGLGAKSLSQGNLTEEGFVEVDAKDAAAASGSATSLAPEQPVLSSSGFLRTGDLGFMHEGELYICGRLKDLIIVRGRNIYPQDIERNAEDLVVDGVKMLRNGNTAAFAVTTPKGEEALHLVAEVTEVQGFNGEKCVESLRSCINKTQGIALSGIHLLKPRSIEKTTSGKIARQWCKKAFLSGGMEDKIIHEWFDDSFAAAPPADEAEAKGKGDGEEEAKVVDHAAKDMSEDQIIDILKKTVAEDVLKTSPDAFDDLVDGPIMDLGLGSMEGMQLLGLLEEKLGAAIPQEILFEEETTLRSLVPIIQAGGSVNLKRTTVIDCAHLAAIDLPKQTEKERRTRRLKVEKKSSWQTGKLEEGAVGTTKDMKAADVAQANLILDLAFARSFAAQVSLGLIAAIVVLGGLVGYMAAGSMGMQLAVLVLGVAGAGLKYTAGSKAAEMQKKGAERAWRRPLTELFSLQMVFEADLDPEDRYLIVASPLTPAASGSGVGTAPFERLAVAHVLAGSMHEAVCGFPVVTLLPESFPSSVRSAAQSLMGFLGKCTGFTKKSTQTNRPTDAPPLVGPTASDAAARKLLRSGTSVAWSLGEVGDEPVPKPLVSLAMTTGAVLVPCLTIQQPEVKGRTAVAVVYGKPVLVPYTSSPHPSLVGEFVELYEAEVKKLRKKYAGACK